MLSKLFANPFLKGITQRGREVIIYLHLLITRIQRKTSGSIIKGSYCLLSCGGPKSTYGENKEIWLLNIVHMFFLSGEMGEVTMGFKLRSKLLSS
ncbi:hypothetical protein BDA96_03G088200 [Sorghum bicolor]|uniref:Uncharacterized protein n=1 Tax=Sorghum bicolor TaxID=4558 RepID=A0A921UMQ2_SORBI|nr:hypothetical protein BDA96_03G088200 [Sorghum bicolor]